MDFVHYQSPKLLGSSPPIMQVSIFGALSTSSQIHRENQRQNCGDYPIYLGRLAKSKIPDRLGFSRHMITRLTTVTTTKTSLKCEFALLQTLSRLFQLVQFVKCWQFFLELNSKRLYQSSGKEKEVVVLC